MFGDNLLPSLVLALGGALAAGTLLALVKPPAKRAEGALDTPPLARSLVQIAIGSIAAVWAAVSMLT